MAMDQAQSLSEVKWIFNVCYVARASGPWIFLETRAGRPCHGVCGRVGYILMNSTPK